MDDAELIRSEIEPDPWHSGAGNARLHVSGVPVWAIASYYYRAAHRDTAMVARDYDVAARAVQAALAYYRWYREAIDYRLAENEYVGPG